MKPRNIAGAIAAVLAATSLAGCNLSLNSGDTPGPNDISKEVTVGTFSKVVVEEAVSATFSQGKSDGKLTVSGSEEAVKCLDATVTDGTLTLGSSCSGFRTSAPRVTGTAELTEATARSAASVRVPVSGTSFRAVAESASTLTLTGKTDSLTATVSGAATLSGNDGFTVQSADVTLAGAASGMLCVTGQVTGAVEQAASLTVSCGGDTSQVAARSGGSVQAG